MVTYGGISFDLAEISYSQRPSTTKQTLGKTLTSHKIIGADSMEYVLEITGEINGTKSNIQSVRNSLIALQDGTKHAYADSTDSQFDGDYAIETGSLNFDRQTGDTFLRFSMRLLEW